MYRYKTWRTAVKYGLGILVLALSAAIAMFFPQWYGAWQDSQLLGEVQLSRRENISFIDTASLDNAGRLQLIVQAEEIMVETYEGYSSRVLQQPQEFLGVCRKQAEIFEESGLIPEFYADLVTEDNCEMVTSPILILNENRILQVNFVVFRDWEEPAERLIMVMDAETDFVYYISFSGMKASEEVLRRFGIDTWGVLEYMAESGGDLKVQSDILELWDIQNVCGAESVLICPSADLGYTEAELFFENFQTKALHCLIVGDAPGFTFMFGIKDWNGLVNQELITYGLSEDEIIQEYDVYAEEREEILEKERKEKQVYDMQESGS